MRSVRRDRAPDDLWALVAGCAIILAVAVIDQLTPQHVIFMGLTLLGPLVASLTARPRQTAGLALLAWLASLALGWSNGIWLEVDHVIRLGLVAVAGAFAVYVAAQREQRVAAMERLARVAELAQEVMLRPPPRVLGHVGLAARYVAASDESSVGGDLYETAYTPYGVRVIIGDVRGKGLDGIRLAATVLAAFREAVWDRDLIQLVEVLEERVRKDAGEEDFVTALLAEWPADGGLRLVNCGHPAPLWVGDDGVRPLEPEEPSPPLGLGATPRLESHPFAPGDRLLLATDGLTEGRDRDGVFFPLPEHADVLRDDSLQDCVDALVLRLLGHLPGELQDDLAVILAERIR